MMGEDIMSSRFENVDLGNPMARILLREQARIKKQNEMLARALGKRFSLPEGEILEFLTKFSEENSGQDS